METYLQITTGRGPAECAWVAAKVLKTLLEEAADSQMEASVISHTKGPENGTLESAIVKLSGQSVLEFAQNWTGTIQWIGQSTYRKFHKRKNWFIGVFAIERSIGIAIPESEIRYETMRSSGAGGQHVNKVSSAVRAIHQPSGTSAFAQDNRSQHLNKKLARERLLQKLSAVRQQEIISQIQSEWENQLQVQRGNLEKRIKLKRELLSGKEKKKAKKKKAKP